MITKKANKQTFAWDPSAFQGKGYWFVLGKNGAYGRAASKAEAIVLGKPKDEEEADLGKGVKGDGFFGGDQLHQR